MRTDRLVLYVDARGKHRWRFVASNGPTLGDSGQGYSSRTRALHGAAIVCAFDPAGVRYIAETREVYGYLGRIERPSGRPLEVISQ